MDTHWSLGEYFDVEKETLGPGIKRTALTLGVALFLWDQNIY